MHGIAPTPTRRPVSPRRRTSCTGTLAAGFTLLELVVTVAILGVLGAMAAPSFGGAIAESRLEDVQRSLTATLRVARAESGMRRERVAVCARASDTACGDDWSGGWIAFVDAPGGTPLALDPDETVLRLQVQDRGDRISVAATSRAPWSTQTLPVPVVSVEPRVRGATSLFVICDARGVDRARAIVQAPSGSMHTSLGSSPEGERLGPWNEPLGCPT